MKVSSFCKKNYTLKLILIMYASGTNWIHLTVELVCSFFKKRVIISLTFPMFINYLYVAKNQDKNIVVDCTMYPIWKIQAILYTAACFVIIIWILLHSPIL